MAAKKSGVEKAIDRFVALLRARYRVARVVLFGSHARGRAKRHSDIDLAVFIDAPVAKRKIALLQEFSALAWETDPRIEAIPFPTHALKVSDPTGFVEEIISSGKVVYSA